MSGTTGVWREEANADIGGCHFLPTSGAICSNLVGLNCGFEMRRENDSASRLIPFSESLNGCETTSDSPPSNARILRLEPPALLSSPHSSWTSEVCCFPSEGFWGKDTLSLEVCSRTPSESLSPTQHRQHTLNASRCRVPATDPVSSCSICMRMCEELYRLQFPSNRIQFKYFKKVLKGQFPLTFEGGEEPSIYRVTTQMFPGVKQVRLTK